MKETNCSESVNRPVSRYRVSPNENISTIDDDDSETTTLEETGFSQVDRATSPSSKRRTVRGLPDEFMAFLHQVVARDHDFDLRFPGNVFDGSPALYDMVRGIAETERVPTGLVACCCLGAVSVGLGKGLRLKVPVGRCSAPNLYLLVVAPSASGKSQVAKTAFEPLWKRDKQVQDEWFNHRLPDLKAEQRLCQKQLGDLDKKISKESSEELLKNYKKIQHRLQKVEMELERRPQILVEDVTREVLTMRLKSSGEVLGLVSADARGVIDNLCGRYRKSGETDEDVLNSAWCLEPHREDRVTRPSVALDEPCLAMLLLVQPDKLEQLCSKPSFIEGGFLPRMLVVNTHASPAMVSADDKFISAVTKSQYEDLISLLEESFRTLREPVFVEMEPEARDLWIQYQNACAELQGDILRDLYGFVGRWAEHVTRIALCLHAAANPMNPQEVRVSVETMQRAIRFMTWVASHQLRILAPIRNKRERHRLDRLVGILQEMDGFEETVRNLKNSHGFTTEELDNLVDTFPDRLLAETKKTGGRPSRRIKLRHDNPENLIA